MDPARQSVAEPGAYRMLQMVLADLQMAKRVLGNILAGAPDPERALHLGAIRSAIAELRTVVPPTSPD